MEYGKLDSSGTDDDFPVQNINVFTQGLVCVTGNLRVSTALVPAGSASPDMEEQIHDLERGAYNAVLKAFIAQSDDLSWCKEKLMSELRKELRVSDVEHRQSLAIVDSDDLIRHIREWRKGGASCQELLSNTAHAMVSSSTNISSHKRLKPTHLTSATSPNYLPRVQSSSGLSSGHLVASSPNYMSRLQPSPATMPSVHIRDNQWNDKLLNQGKAEGAVIPVGHNRQVPVAGKGRGSLKLHLGKSCAALPGGGNKKEADRIEIRETRTIIHEVQRVCGVANPDPVLVEKAKLILKEHEQSLLEAIAKLDSTSDLAVSLEQGYAQGELLRTYGSEDSDRDRCDRKHTKSAERLRNRSNEG